MEEREVVVTTVLSFEPRHDGKIRAARLKDIGLTAYGKSDAEAEDKVKRQFARLVSEYRQLGLLEQRLNEVGVTWCWRNEYKDASLPVQNVARMGGIRRWISRSVLRPRKEGVLTLQMAMAA